jgi:hypothetical protein
MKASKSMEEIWAIKEKIGSELEGKTDAEILAYFRDREPEWAKTLPSLEVAESQSKHSQVARTKGT